MESFPEMREVEMSMKRRSGPRVGVMVVTFLCACGAAKELETSAQGAQADAATQPDGGAAADAGKPPINKPEPDEPFDGVPGCGVLHAIVRDFTPTHSDFENERFKPKSPTEARKAVEGLVESELGADGLPVFRSTGETRPAITSERSFAQWYRDVAAVNAKLAVDLVLTQRSDGTWVYDNDAYFPIDGMGFGNYRKFSNGLHNYHFTTELHLTFDYEPGQVFTFRGDDDLWLFINGKLALDLGGPHLPLEGTVDMDGLALELGFAPGDEVSMDIFQAERQTEQSSFHIETNIDCLVVLI